jgi:hypothetical protein
MAEAVGLSVAKLLRVRYAGLELGTLARGKARPLLQREIDRLRKLTGGTPSPARRPARSATPRRAGGSRRRGG